LIIGADEADRMTVPESQLRYRSQTVIDKRLASASKARRVRIPFDD
jgi:hypothetical protein